MSADGPAVSIRILVGRIEVTCRHVLRLPSRFELIWMPLRSQYLSVSNYLRPRPLVIPLSRVSERLRSEVLISVFLAPRQFLYSLGDGASRHSRRPGYSRNSSIADSLAFSSRYQPSHPLVQERHQSTKTALDIGLLHQHQYKTESAKPVLLIF